MVAARPQEAHRARRRLLDRRPFRGDGGCGSWRRRRRRRRRHQASAGVHGRGRQPCATVAPTRRAGGRRRTNAVSHVRRDTWEGAHESGRAAGLRAETGWEAYWDRLEEHVIFRVEAADYVARLKAALGPHLGGRVLDFGCGFGFIAELLAPMVAELFVFDASERMRRRAQLRLAGRANVRLLR